MTCKQAEAIEVIMGVAKTGVVTFSNFKVSWFMLVAFDIWAVRGCIRRLTQCMRNPSTTLSSSIVDASLMHCWSNVDHRVFVNLSLIDVAFITPGDDNK